MKYYYTFLCAMLSFMFMGSLHAQDLDWYNTQWVSDGTNGSTSALSVDEGTSVTVYGQAYEPSVTDAAGQGTGVLSWVGFNATDSDPATWDESVWKAATYLQDQGNNDEYSYTSSSLVAGTYYVATRWQLNGASYTYGGASAGNGGPWDGTNNTSVSLTVNPVTSNITSSNLIGHAGFWPTASADAQLANAFDGDFNTFLDPAEQWGWVGIHLSTPTAISKVQFAPRNSETWGDVAGRMVNAVVRGSNSSNFLNVAEDLHTITTAPAYGQMTEATVTPTEAYSYYYILLAAGSWGNMSELKFFDGDTELVPGTGVTIIGHKDGAGTYNSTNGAQTVFDNDYNTFYDCAWEGWDGANKAGWVGYDFGVDGKALYSVKYAPRAGWTGRMVNGEIRGSNSVDYLINYDVLHTITAEPSEGVLTEAVINSTTSYRYLYYVGNNGNISELELYERLDAIAPEITLLGDAAVTVEVGSTYTDAGATALDNFDGDITANIVVGGDTVDTATAGTYTITYDVSDGAGNAATQVSRTVTVVQPPLTITTTVCSTATSVRLTGPWWGWDPAGGPIAADNGDGTWTFTLDPMPTADMEYLLVVDGVQENLISIMANGGTCAPVTDYSSYANRQWTVGSGNVTNNYGQCGSTCVAPVITLTGTDVTINVGDTYTDAGATASDDEEGDVTANIVVGGDTVDTATAGTYTITYDVSDGAGNAATQVSRTVTVEMLPCGNAIALTPGTQQCGNTSTFGDTFDDSTCLGSYDGGDDALYSYTATEDGETLDLTLTGQASWTGFAMSKGCPTGGTEVCVGSQTSSGSGTLNFVSDPLEAGEVYYIHISTYPSPQSTAYCLDATLIPAPSCLAPTSFATSDVSATSVTIGWTAGASETTWNIEYGADGFTQGAGTTVAITTNPYTISGLISNTAYDVYIQADCGAGDTSDWVGPLSFTTPCEIFVPDYTEDFDPFLDGCWSEANGPTPSGTTSGWTEDGFGNVGSTGAARFNIYGTASDEWLISPTFDLSNGGYEINLDVALTQYASTSSGTIGSDDAVYLMQSLDNGTTWTTIYTWDASNSPSNTGDNVTIDIASLTSASAKFAVFALEGSTSGGDLDFFVDNFSVRTPPSCFSPSANSLSADNIATTTADLSWTAGDSETAWNIEYGPEGFTQGAGTTVAVTSNPYTLSGLTSNTAYDYYIQADCGASGTSAWVGPYTFSTACEAFDVPYSENFNSTATGTSSNPTVPNCWSFIDGGSGYGYVSSTSANSFYIYNSSDTSGDYILVSPQTNLLTSGTNRVSFDIDGSMGQDFIIGTLSDPTDGSTFTAIETITLATSDYESYIVDIPAGTDLYLGFKHGQSGTYYSYYLDNIEVLPQPTCLEVSDVAAVSTATGFDLTWTAGASESAWNVEYGPSGFTQGSGTTVATTSASASVSGLTSNTTYDVYVQADCGAGDTGAWVGPLSVTTHATCGDTLTDSGGSTGNYASNELTIVTVSPTNAGDLVTLTFNSFNTESSYDKMWVYNGPDTTGEVLLDGVSGSTVPDPITSSHSTGSLTVKFDSDSGVNYAGYEIDVTCAAAPTCMAPSGLTISDITDQTASFSWTVNGTETAWNIEYGPSGFTQGSGTSAAVTANPYSISGLDGNTDYDVYIQADCGVDGTSDWAGPVSFTTEPAPIVPDYLNDFSTYPGEFWSEGQGSLASGPSGTSSSWTSDGFGNSGTTGAARVNIYGTSPDEWLISPMFDLSGGTYYLNLDAAAAEYNSSSLDAVWGSDDFATLMASTDGGSTWTELYRWDANNNPGLAGAAMPQITLEGYTATSKFALYGESSMSNEDIDFFIDNFQITSMSLGVEDVNLAQFSYYPNPVNDVLTIKSQQTLEDITVFNMLGQTVLRQSPNTRECSVDLSAMQSGAYFVQVSIGNTVETVRILKK